MRFPVLTPELCALLAHNIFGKDYGYSNKTVEALDKEICQSLIGTSYNVCAEIWNLIDPANKDELCNAHPKHLFWALVFLKNYCTEPILVRVVGDPDPKTFRKWVWLFVKSIDELKPRVIIFNNRFKKWDGESTCLISLDGMDCPIEELYPFDEGIFSKKLNGPGVKYEMGVCIKTGDIVWFNGPFRAAKHDVTIFNEDGLRDALCHDECVEADSGYQGDRFKNPNVAQTSKDRKDKSVVRARHENINGRIKKFDVLNQVFRHRSIEKHKLCATAAAVITQLEFELEQHLYAVKYNPRYD